MIDQKEVETINQKQDDLIMAGHRPRHEHPEWRAWAERNGYLKKNLDEACVKIAQLIVENREIKQELKVIKSGQSESITLPFGEKNTLRSFKGKV